jgi:hypothetical protein
VSILGRDGFAHVTPLSLCGLNRPFLTACNRRAFQVVRLSFRGRSHPAVARHLAGCERPCLGEQALPGNRPRDRSGNPYQCPSVSGAGTKGGQHDVRGGRVPMLPLRPDELRAASLASYGLDWRLGLSRTCPSHQPDPPAPPPYFTRPVPSRNCGPLPAAVLLQSLRGGQAARSDCPSGANASRGSAVPRLGPQKAARRPIQSSNQPSDLASGRRDLNPRPLDPSQIPAVAGHAGLDALSPRCARPDGPLNSANCARCCSAPVGVCHRRLPAWLPGKVPSGDRFEPWKSQPWHRDLII